MSKYDIVVPTSMGVRLTPVDYRPVHISDRYTMQATSAETNVLSVPAALGMRTKALTAFVKDSPIALYIKNELSRRHIEYEGPELEQGGPWGLRHQFNIADSGYGLRAPSVWNDRSGEIGRILDEKYFDLDKLFFEDGVRIVHMSGLIAALSPETARFCARLAARASEAGAKVCFDLNYRASFWKDRHEELSRVFADIASRADMLVGNEEDFQLALGLKGPEAGGRGLSGKLDSFKAMIENARSVYPNVTTFATTLREAINVNRHLWGAVMLSEGKWYEAEPREIGVLDRIGGGDGFVSGLLYATLRGMDCADRLKIGWASGALAVTAVDDYATPASEDVLWSIWNGNARVKR